MRILLLTISLLSIYAYAQERAKFEQKGAKFVKTKKYNEGLNYFKELSPEERLANPVTNYYLGMLYYDSPNDKELGTPFLEQYISDTDSAEIMFKDRFHVFYCIAKLHHLNYNFNAAEKYYLQYIEHINVATYFTKKEARLIIEDAKHQIECCKYGRISIQNPRNVVIQNLGGTINSIYSEYAPVSSQNERNLFFTSRRPDTEGGKKAYDGDFYEDIYSAELSKANIYEEIDSDYETEKGTYFKLAKDLNYFDFKKVGNQVNSNKHDGSIQLAHGDSVLYFYREQDVWSVKIDSNNTEKPKKLGINVNSNQFEPSVFLSHDENKLFVVSDRPGGYGGLDIYLSLRKENGEWSELKNLGPNVNTTYDEDAPYLDGSDGTLYFASKGHSSIGEYDIFRTNYIDSLWTHPVNIGYPVNTPGNDIYFSLAQGENRGYYSSNDIKGNGEMDLYRITFADQRDPLAELSGFVTKGKEFKPSAATISLYTKDREEEISAISDSIDGSYSLLLGHGKSYEMRVESKGFIPFNKTIDIPELDSIARLYQEVHLKHIFDKKENLIGQKITIYNESGDADTSVTALYDEYTFKNLSNSSNTAVLKAIVSDTRFFITKDSLLKLMETNPDLKFEFDDLQSVHFLIKNGLDQNNPDSYNEKKWVDIIKELKEKSIFKEEIIRDSTAVTAVEGVKGLFFTVQIGVYSTDVPTSTFYNLAPINSQNINDGTIRYSTGQYQNIANAEKRKETIVKLGITDAFVTAYYKGERVSIAKAKQLIK